jgi:hypothetical protein
MKRLCLAMVVGSIGCALPEGMMADTDDTETSSGSSGSEGTMTTVGTSVTAGTSMTTTTATTTMGNTTATTSTDPDTGDSSITATDATTTGDCPPGDLGCPCDIGSTCSGELTCIDGTCVEGIPCDEPEGEPNDDEASAVELDEVTCSAMAMSTDAGLAGAESDWFTYHALQGIACPIGVDPHVSIQADSDLAVCIFATCDTGDTNVGCSGGAQESDSPDGVAGCCDQNEVGINNFGCGFNSSDATVWVRVTSIEEICIPYALEFEF